MNDYYMSLDGDLVSLRIDLKYKEILIMGEKVKGAWIRFRLGSTLDLTLKNLEEYKLPENEEIDEVVDEAVDLLRSNWDMIEVKMLHAL